MMLTDVQRIIDTLTVPAAEYVPAISDALTLLDELAEKLRHPHPHPVTEDARDGERYRYLRNRIGEVVLTGRGPSAGCWIDCESEDGTLTLLTGEDADAAIDVAMSKETK